MSTEGNDYIKTYRPDNCNKKKGKAIPVRGREGP
jgi:hypothetical protein